MNNQNNLFFFVMYEEIPVLAQQNVLQQVSQLVNDWFTKYKVEVEVILHVSHIRMLVELPNLPQTLHQKDEIIRGPRTHVSQNILNKFLDKNNCDMQFVFEKDNFYYAVKKYDMLNLQNEIANLCKYILNGLSWSTSMRWNSEVYWSRPVRCIGAYWNDQHINFDWYDLQSSKFMFDSLLTRNIIEATSANHALSQLLNIGRYANHEHRKQKLQKEIDTILLNTNYSLHDDADEVINEINYIVEAPYVYLVKMKKSFANLPEIIRRTVMVQHQQYVPLMNKKTLADAFIAVANYDVNKDVFAHQSNLTLEARFNDANFFWTEDCNSSLKDYDTILQKIEIYKNLGFVYDQKMRLQKLVPNILQDIYKNITNHDDQLILCEKALQYYKIDLPMKTVYEFDSLEGEIAALYAEHFKKYEIAQIIRNYTNIDNFELYFNTQQFDKELKNKICNISAAIGIASRMDTLVGFFGVGQMPTGSSDPLGLRRLVYEILQLLPYCKVSLVDIEKNIYQLYQEQDIALEKSSLISFIDQCSKRHLENLNYKPFVITIAMKYAIPCRLYVSNKLQNILFDDLHSSFVTLYNRLNGFHISHSDDISINLQSLYDLIFQDEITFQNLSDLLNESFCNMNEKMSDKLRLQDNVLILQKMCKPIHNFIDFCFIEKHDQKHQICALFTKLQEILFFYVAI